MKTNLILILILILIGCQSTESRSPNYQSIDGMVLIPAGEVDMGSDQGLPHEMNGSREKVAAFYMDKHPITVQQFSNFISTTGYITEAEAFGSGAVFNMETKVWDLIDGANWKYPMGPDSPEAPQNHPVTQVSWNDAVAYCDWVGKRLPTEIEWEHAAKNAENTNSLYSWGDNETEDGLYLANFWQGTFPTENEELDGYAFTNPVAKFGETKLGLTDMAGNVWEWTDDWYGAYNQSPSRNQQKDKVLRGGSFLCDKNWCYGFRTTGRSMSSPESAMFHIGFRTVMDAE